MKPQSAMVVAAAKVGDESYTRRVLAAAKADDNERVNELAAENWAGKGA